MAPRTRKPKPHVHASNASAASAVVASLRESGAIEDTDEALVTAFLSLAVAVDAEPLKADLWREYRAASAALREAASGGVDDEAASFLVTVSTPGRSEVGNSKKS